MEVNIHEAKTHFSRLVEKALRGEEIIICRAGKPVLRLSPLSAAAGPRTPGLSRGSVVLGEDFDEPLTEALLSEFET
jgi:prevent-host-death family protein